ncbi:MAG: Stk1 family PASTA domain-containing Ser/Thr kinase [Actinobacteria bacterium]|nr:Stk1 family PASTA domain-containing Ser/Thr kinase [Actinomycetota bacterium]
MSDVFQPEQVLSGRYRVLRKIGGGGMADVYLCEDLSLGRRVALKVLLQRFLDDPNFVERFRREAKAAAGLNQANLVSIYDWGEVDGTYFIVMEYVEGETLKDLVRRKGRLSGNEAVRISLQLLAALEFAHRTGIVHRDIKPQNVMLDRDGNAKVTDFGIARAADSGMTEAGSILGTAQYLAPEQARGHRVDERSDLYSVGIVLYEMLTGTVPFKGDSAVTVALKHVNEMAAEPAQIVPGLPYALNQIVLKAIAKDPGQRYQTADQFARDLRSAQVGGPVAAATFDPGAEATRLMSAGVPAGATSVMTGGPLDQAAGDRGRRRRRWPWVLVIVLLLLVIAAAAYGLVRAMGAGGVAVPTVVGKSQAAALTKLEEAGFKAGVQEEYSDNYDVGFVSRQAPAGGTKLRKGDTVDIWVSNGSETVTLADFKGWTSGDVRDWLSQNGLSPLEKSGKSSSVPSGRVFKQDPPAGDPVKRGDTITYWVSSGKPQATVPDLSGLTQDEAQTALAGAGLLLGVVTPEPSSTVPSGQVIRQDPAALVKMAKGSAVNIVVSSGSPSPSPSPTASTVSVPNVYGMDSTSATDKLTADGFGVTVRQKVGTGQPPGTVVRMVPDAGTEVASGSTVLLIIAK